MTSGQDDLFETGQNDLLEIIRTGRRAKIRVLHVTDSLDWGGIDSWLMRFLALRRPEVKFDFAVLYHGGRDDEARQLGADIHYLPYRWPYSVYRNMDNLERIVAQGRYDVVHYHKTDFSGALLKIAMRHGVPVRVDHSHNTRGGDPYSLAVILRRIYHHLINRRRVRKYATSLLACSEEAGRFAFGRIWKKKRPNPMVYCGVPLGQFRQTRDETVRRSLCKQYGIPEDAVVIGTLGRFSFQKNQEFSVRVFAELAKRDPRYVLFLGGGGREGDAYTDMVKGISRQFAVENRVVFPGSCSNAPALFCQLFDVFLMPSRFEGFGIVFIEAAVCGLHTVCSHVISNDIMERIPECFTTLAITDSPVLWANAVEEALKKRKTPQQGFEVISRTPFSIETSVDNLLAVYAETLKKTELRQQKNT
ncbi:MAG: glycosyltransferase [Planctomycetaceae bacterium]|nr:glycosyltransferase [Planctomycetaceae bacterium]